MMRCDVHCPPPGSALRGPLLALAGLAGLSVAVWVASQLGGFLVAAVVVVYVLAAAGTWGLWRTLRPKHKRVVNPVTARAALPVPPLAIEAPRTAPAAVVLDVRDGERLGA